MNKRRHRTKETRTHETEQTEDNTFSFMVAIAGKERECHRFLIDLMVNEDFLLATMSQGRFFPSKIPSEKKHSSLASDGCTINSLASCTKRILHQIWRPFDHWSPTLTEHLYPICIQHDFSRKNSFSWKRVTGSVLLFRPRQQGIESTLFASACEASSTLSSANLLSCSEPTDL